MTIKEHWLTHLMTLVTRQMPKKGLANALPKIETLRGRLLERIRFLGASKDEVGVRVLHFPCLCGPYAYLLKAAF
jgi:hypothetical protein